jgi:hypothetical protein
LICIGEQGDRVRNYHLSEEKKKWRKWIWTVISEFREWKKIRVANANATKMALLSFPIACRCGHMQRLKYPANNHITSSITECINFPQICGLVVEYDEWITWRRNRAFSNQLMPVWSELHFSSPNQPTLPPSFVSKKMQSSRPIKPQFSLTNASDPVLSLIRNPPSLVTNKNLKSAGFWNAIITTSWWAQQSTIDLISPPEGTAAAVPFAPKNNGSPARKNSWWQAVTHFLRKPPAVLVEALATSRFYPSFLFSQHPQYITS